MVVLLLITIVGSILVTWLLPLFLVRQQIPHRARDETAELESPGGKP
jgi:hypothetical protein